MKLQSLFAAVVALSFAQLSYAGPPVDPDADYDRFDGRGPSGKKVHVIEWEGNLEIHVYPKGSLSGLALKLDKKNKDKPVMVIGYRFDNAPKTQHIRRAILGIPLSENFKVYRDPKTDDYDKIIISNNGLSNQVVAFKLDPEPTQMYPEGHPALKTAAKEEKNSARKPAAEEESEVEDSSGPSVDEDGTIQPFYMKKKKR